MARRKSAEKASRWEEILRRQAESGVSIREFCMTEELSEPSFYAWRRKLREETQAGYERGQAIARPGCDPRALFVPVHLLGGAAALEIIHPLGYRIQVNGEVNPVALRQVIQALQEGSAS